MISASIPIVGFTAPSGTGKTTLLEKLIPLLADSGLRVGLIKKSHHDFEIDHPGKDSYRLRKAGATTILLCSPFRRAIITEHDTRTEPNLTEELACIDQSKLDIILIEGFRNHDFPKIALHRQESEYPPDLSKDRSIIAIASDSVQAPAAGIPQLDLNNPLQIRDFILATFFKS